VFHRGALAVEGWGLPGYQVNRLQILREKYLAIARNPD
jgi:hypothetical protein